MRKVVWRLRALRRSWSSRLRDRLLLVARAQIIGSAITPFSSVDSLADEQVIRYRNRFGLFFELSLHIHSQNRV
jgi:hypothetical protein